MLPIFNTFNLYIMRKHLFFLCVLFLFAQLTWAITIKPVTAPADIPAYYANANGKSGTSLYNALNTITNKGFGSLGYDGALEAYPYSDVYPSDPSHPDYVADKKGKLWDMYGACSFQTGDECGNYSGECDCYNREHSIPKSWWGGGKNDMYSDIFHLVPTDGYVNNRRSAYAFGEVDGTPTYTYNGCKLGSSKSTISTEKNTLLGTSATCSGTVFEPRDEYKGDFARGYLGMIAKYSNSSYSITSGDGDMIFEAFSSTTHFGLTKYGVVLLMKWHRMDPVSQKEIDRNNGIQKTQGNRNPFIDYPYLAEYIWGEHAGETVDLSQLLPSTDPAFVPGVSDGSNTNSPRISSPTGTIDCGATNTTDAVYKQITIQGVNLEDGNLTLSISGTNASFFSLATTTVTKAQAEAGYSVTLTYNPNADGTHSATLKINGCGVSNYTVQLKGKCTTVHTITWIDEENTQTTKVENNTSLVMPTNTPANCSDERVFVGWTATPNYSGDEAPSDIFTTSTKTITAPATFYAVYADGETVAGGGSSEKSITFSEQGYANGANVTTVTMDNCTLTFDQGAGSNPPKYYTSGTAVRCYPKNTLTITSENTISSIAVSTASGSYGGTISANTGTYSNGEWTGSSNSVTLTHSPSDNAQWRITAITVTTGGGSSTTYSNYSLECTSVPKVTVTFHANNGTNATAVQQIPQNTTRALNPNTFTYANHNFLGWDTDSSAATVVYEDGASITAGTANIDLYAVWEEVIVITHTVTWKANGSVFTTNTGVVDGETVALPTTNPDDCSETRVFKGWTEESEFTTEPAYLSGAQTITDDVTFYAVYADKETSGGGGGSSEAVTLKMEDFAATSGISGDFSFATAKNSGSTEPAYNATGKDLRIYAKGSLTVTSTTAMTKIVLNISTQGLKRLAPITASTGAIATQASGDEIVTWTGSATEVVFTVGDKATYGSDSDKAGQLCFTSMEITTGEGGGSTTTYSNFSPRCSSEPIVLPEYTVTFYNNGAEYAIRTGHKGETMEAVAAPDAPCPQYTFKGWSSHQYAADNTDVPVLDFTGIIPEGDATYYAVFCHSEEGGSIIMTDDYKKITSTDELTDGNYLVVGEKDGLFAMSATFTGYYLHKANVVASGDVISSPADSIIWSIIVDKDNELLTFNNTAVGYLYIEKSESGTKTYYNIKLGANTTDNKFSYAIDSETGGWIFTSVTYTDRQLEYYADKSNWSFFTKQDAPVSLYQQQEGTTATVYYTTAPVCTPTAIDLTESDECAARKVFINGHLYILKGDQMFNLQGARVR